MLGFGGLIYAFPLDEEMIFTKATDAASVADVSHQVRFTPLGSMLSCFEVFWFCWAKQSILTESQEQS